MSFDAENSLPENFSGIVRLFPLPNMVLFPGVIQALHIFEPRYREMMKEALETDRLITMALPQSGPEIDLELSPPLHQTVCIGKIITHKVLEDGRFNLLLMGVQRARIVEEIPCDQPYRQARVEVESETCQASTDEIESAKKKLISHFSERAKSLGNFDAEMVANLSNPGLPFGMLVDLICFSTGSDAEFMQKMLETNDVWTRCQMLMARIEALQENPAEKKAPFPPNFSSN